MPYSEKRPDKCHVRHAEKSTFDRFGKFDLRPAAWSLFPIIIILFTSVFFCVTLSGEFTSFAHEEERDLFVDLTDEERSWLNRNPEKLKLLFNTHFPPIEFASPSGSFAGMSADIISIVERRLGVTFLKTPSLDWNRHFSALESGDCAIAPTIVRTVEGERYAFFTDPYAMVPVVIITARGLRHNLTLDDLDGRRVTFVSGYATEKYLENRSQGRFEMVPVTSVMEGLRRVSFGEMNAMVENLAVAAYYIEQEGIPNLQVAGSTDYSFPFSIGVSRKYPLLYSSIRKALDAIPENKLKAVRNRWISLEITSGLSPETLRLLKLIGVFTALLLFGLAGISFFLKRRLNNQIASLRTAQKELLDQADRLRLATEVTNAGIWDFYPETGKAYISMQLYTMLGYPPGDLNTSIDDWTRFIHPEDLDPTMRSLQAYNHAGGKDVFEFEFRMRRAEDDWCWVLAKGRATAWDEKGTPTRITGLILNIQNIKEVQEKLAHSEARLRAIFDNAPYAIVINSFEDGRYLEVNKAFLESIGAGRKEILGLHSYDITHLPEQETAELLDTLVKSGVVKNHEVTIPRGDGTQAHVLFSSVLMEIQGQKQVLSMTVDVTDRKNAERTLRESEFRFRAYFNSNPEGILMINFEGKILDANKALLKMSGYSPEELIGSHFSKFIPESYQEVAERAFFLIKEGVAQEQPFEMAYIRSDGANLPIIIKGWRITDEKSNPVSLGVFVQDLTREKQLTEEKALLEKQLQQTQKMEAIGTLAGGIAHDFNNILGGIIGYTELAMMDESTDPENRRTQYLSRVLSAGNRAKDLVQQILRFSRRDESTMGPISITPLIKESIKLLRSTLPPTIRIEQCIQSDQDRIIGDPTQIHQVIMNLCTNAYHAMRDTGGDLTLYLENVTLHGPRQFMSLKVPPGDYLKMGVAESGGGINPQTLERIFEPYFTTKALNEGTGLGLSVTLGIVKSHHGLIEVSSRVREGTRFNVYFPVTQAGLEEEIPPAAALPSGNKERVLIVDDELFFLDVVRENLETSGYQVTANQSSLKTLEVFRQNPEGFDLLITDQSMPEMTGVQLVAEIRKFNRDIPIILCTGYSDIVTEQSARHYGISRFLMKPVTAGDLARAVHAALGGEKEEG